MRRVSTASRQVIHTARVAVSGTARPMSGVAAWSWRARFVAGAGVVVGAAALAVAGAWLFGRPSVSVSVSGGALVRADVGGIGSRVSAVRATVAGRPLALDHGAGGLVPAVKLPQGEAVEVSATVRTPSWISWLTGSQATTRTVLRTPSAVPSEPVAFATTPGAVDVDFDHPVSVVHISAAGASQVVRLQHPSSTVAVRVPANATAGAVEVSAAPLPWETLPSRQSTVTWFVSADARSGLAVADPAPGSTTAAANSPVSLTFAEPVSKLLGGTRPRLSPAVAGSWSEPNANTLVFTPSGFGFGPGTAVTVTFDRPVSVMGGVGTTLADASSSYSFTTAQGSVLRLEQILAELEYLPLDFVPAPGQALPDTLAAAVTSMSQPLAGGFVWRWSSTPASLVEQWTVGTDNVVLKGALMAFDAATQADYDGYQADSDTVQQLADGSTWGALVDALLKHQLDPDPYSYVYVSQSLPETLTVWEDGSVVLRTPCNTGISIEPTAEGTFPIYVRYTFNYMSGFNPDGSYYDDPVYWINYFNGGDAVHGFYRASYGWPQSLGCVELPIATAEVAFEHLAIGDLVTVGA